MEYRVGDRELGRLIRAEYKAQLAAWRAVAPDAWRNLPNPSWDFGSTTVSHAIKIADESCDEVTK
jgi:hypothetical protein